MIRLAYTVPPKLVIVPKFNNILKKEIQGASIKIREDFLRPTRTWKEKIAFGRHVIERPNGIYMEVSTRSKIYRYVNNGTRSHPIPKARVRRPRKILRFQRFYTSKTKVMSLSSSPGGQWGGDVFRKSIKKHPGSEGRFFDVLIAILWDDELYAITRKVLERIAGRHSVVSKGGFLIKKPTQMKLTLRK
jgi:hypothetical protein